jgi:phosphatidate cytidylyltransferase
MNETLTRSLSGAVYVAIMWFGTSYSNLSCSILFAVLGIICLYEMLLLRKGKSKILALSYVLIPFLLIQDLIWNYLSFSIYDTQVWMSEFILSLFVLTWTFDTFAYIAGVRFGKHKIMPTVSPNKSWEGFFGGFIFTVIAAYLTVNYFSEIELNHIIAISLLIPFTATIGDFIESYYKRKAEVKDSGNFIPGHGGMLDRMDAFMITIPTIYIIINLL